MSKSKQVYEGQNVGSQQTDTKVVCFSLLPFCGEQNKTTSCWIDSTSHACCQIYFNTKTTLISLSVLNDLNKCCRMSLNPTFAKSQQQKKDAMTHQLQISQFDPHYYI